MPKAPTMRDIAREAGVSLSAVSHAFHRPNEISPDLRERVLTLARRHGYTPDPRARGLRNGTSSLVALVVANIAEAYFAAVASAVRQAIAPEGYHLVVLDSATREGERWSLEAVRDERMAGAIVDSYHMHPEEAHLIVRHRPVVFVGDADEPCAFSRVGIPNYTAAYTATTYLAAQGRKRIAHIGGLPSVGPALRRSEGYRRALADMDVGPPIEIIGDFSFASGYTAMNELLRCEHMLDAVFAATDAVAAGALQALREHAIRVPDDVAVVGFDNVNEAIWTAPPLTTMNQPAAAIGAAAASLLLKAIREPGVVETIAVECLLVRRGSA